MTLGLALIVVPACDEGDEGGEDEAAGTETGTETDGDGDGDGDSGKAEGDGDTTGELMGCALHETADACLAEAGCGVVVGYQVVEDGQGNYCTQSEKAYIGCVFTGDLCPMLPNILCSGDEVWSSSGCVPDNATICESPGEITGVCP